MTEMRRSGEKSNSSVIFVKGDRLVELDSMGNVVYDDTLAKYYPNLPRDFVKGVDAGIRL